MRITSSNRSMNCSEGHKVKVNMTLRSICFGGNYLGLKAVLFFTLAARLMVKNKGEADF